MSNRDPEVGNLQRFLSSLDIHDHEGKPLVADELFGARTKHALKVYQAARALSQTGSFDMATRKQAQKEGFLPFIRAKNFGPFFPKKRDVSLIVIHTMENMETDSGAENVARWFAGENPKFPPPKNASAHYMIDSDSIVQSVRDDDVAWGAGKVDPYALHFEHAGTAAQSEFQWGDDYSTKMLELSARLLARKCKEYNIPLRRLDNEGLERKEAGVCGHNQCSKVFGGTHWDPGPNFPWDLYLALARKSM